MRIEELQSIKVFVFTWDFGGNNRINVEYFLCFDTSLSVHLEYKKINKVKYIKFTNGLLGKTNIAIEYWH